MFLNDLGTDMFPGQGQLSLDCEVLFRSEHLVKGVTVTLPAVRDQLLAVPEDFGSPIGGAPSAKSHCCVH